MHTVVTLAEKDYIKGALVLCNSLIRNGFEGNILIGYRSFDNMPIGPLSKLRKHPFVQWLRIDTPLHFTNYKPQFMLRVLQACPECSKLTYIDPDIVLNAPFAWINSWSDTGPAVCGDVNWQMPRYHPTRKQWIKLISFEVNHQLDNYYNAGFLSLRRQDIGFLQLWSALIEEYGATNIPLDSMGNIGDWRTGGRWQPFFAPDQDALNVALMAWSGPITTLGPDIMSFTGFGELPHAIGSNKPWDKNYILEAIKGRPPRHVDKLFWLYADKPLPLTSRLRLVYISIILRITSFFSRFYSQ